ncbi:MAG: hypothetical protein H0W73_20680 [Bacteroidetes bacterium]|nr:hypothetical protein [Bacteroidota bacterium]
MKPFKIFFVLILFATGIIFSSCSKGYEVRVSNFNTETLDSVVIGNNTIVFTQVEKQATTEFRKIKAGTYTVKFITKTKNEYGSSINIPKKDGGKRTIQIDGINSISVLEE